MEQHVYQHVQYNSMKMMPKENVQIVKFSILDVTDVKQVLHANMPIAMIIMFIFLLIKNVIHKFLQVMWIYLELLNNVILLQTVLHVYKQYINVPLVKHFCFKVINAKVHVTLDMLG